MRRFLLLALLIGGCGDTCELPSSTKYNCEPLPAGSSGCIGGPIYGDDRDQQDDKDKVFPEHCRAEIPACSSHFQGSLRSFVCMPGGWAELI